MLEYSDTQLPFQEGNITRYLELGRADRRCVSGLSNPVFS
jgi:hypothetical protein